MATVLEDNELSLINTVNPDIRLDFRINHDNRTDQPKVFIGVMTRGSIQQEMVTWILWMKEREINVGDVKLLCVSGSKQNDNANILISEFLKSDCTHILIMNDDLDPDKGLVDRLLHHDKDLVGNVVGIWREWGILLCAFNGEHGKQKLVDFTKQRCGPCDWVGGGCMMIKRRVVEKLKQPYFYRIIGEDGTTHIGSDENLCRKAKKEGFDVWYCAEKPIAQTHELLINGQLDPAGETKTIMTSQSLQGNQRTIDKP